MFELLVLQMIWPPEYQTFISGRLSGLAGAGVKIKIVTSCPGQMDASLLPFGSIVRLPHARERKASIVWRAAVETICAVFVDLTQTLRLVRVGLQLNQRPTDFFVWWLRSIPFLRAHPDIIHFEWNGTAIEYEWLPDFMKCPFVVSCRGRQINIVPHLPGQESFTQGLQRTLQRAAAVHGVSRHILNEAAIQFGLLEEKAKVIFTSVDPDVFTPRAASVQLRNSQVRLISVGVSMWRKGYEYLVLALKEVIEAGYDARLELADFDGPEQERIIFTANDLGIADRVHILGRLSQEEVKNRLWANDIFVLSALSEGISNALVEAMACGLPVITTNCGGMSEAVQDGVEGFVVPPRDPAMMAAAIIRLIKNPELRFQMGEAGRARAQTQFSPKTQTQQFISMYRQVLSSA